MSLERVQVHVRRFGNFIRVLSKLFGFVDPLQSSLTFPDDIAASWIGKTLPLRLRSLVASPSPTLTLPAPASL
jgi:hypothetical protein